jgi:hypothetical protein
VTAINDARTANPTDKLIDLMIPGAQKAASTALLHYLSRHPAIVGHLAQEMNFFVNPAEAARAWVDVCREYYADPRPESRLVAKSASLMYDEAALQRLRVHNQDVRLAIILRDPVTRAYSAYWYARSHGYEPIETFESAVWESPTRFGGDWIAASHCSYLEYGDYATALRKVFSVFSRTSVDVLLDEDLRSDPMVACRPIIEGLGLQITGLRARADRYNSAARARSQHLARWINQSDVPKLLARRVMTPALRRRVRDSLNRFNRADFRAPPMSDAIRSELAAHYAPMVSDLEALLGRSLAGWSEPRA